MKERVVFRADASALIGSGHIVRCLALAEELRRHCAEITFVAREMLPVLEQRIRDAGHDLRLLPPPRNPGRNQGFTYAHWLSEEAETDARQTLDVMRGLGRVNWLVVDHYGIDAHWERIAREGTVRLMVIDDMADRPHDCDLLLDQTFGCTPAHYARLTPDFCNLLLGTRYALLRSRFGCLREPTLADRRNRKRPCRVLVNFGSHDALGLTRKAARLLITEFENLEIDVVLGSQTIDDLNLTDVRSHPRVTYHDFDADMPALMARADLALGAAGVSSWERCTLGLPTLLVITAENQRKIAEALTAEGAVVPLNGRSASFTEEIRRHVETLCNDRNIYMRMVEKSAALCDGKGAKRVAQILTKEA